MPPKTQDQPNFESEFIALVCPQCGGKVELDPVILDEQFVKIDEDDYMFIGTTTVGSQSAKCTHCGTGFIRKDHVAVFVDTGNTRSINTGGGAFINGNVTLNGGDFVGRDKKTTTIIRRG